MPAAVLGLGLTLVLVLVVGAIGLIGAAQESKRRADKARLASAREREGAGVTAWVRVVVSRKSPVEGDPYEWTSHREQRGQRLTTSATTATDRTRELIRSISNDLN